jgi:recombination protein RecA
MARKTVETKTTKTKSPKKSKSVVTSKNEMMEKETKRDLSTLFKPLPSNNPIIDPQQLMAEINQEFGENTLILANNDRINDKRPRLSTGSLALDYLSMGYAKGKIHTVSGDSSVGKSHLMLKAIAWYQKMFPTEIICLIDAENSFEVEFAIMAGIDLDNPNLVIFKPESLEEAYKVARRMQKKGVGLIVIDSVESLATEKDSDTDEGESKQMGEKQKMTSNFLKVITNRNNKAWREGQDGTTFLLVLQLREKMGVAFGDPKFEPGGQALIYYPHSKIRLMESQKERSADKKTVLRSTITATVKKSRQVGKDVSITYYFNFVTTDGTPTGIDHYEELITIAELEGLIVKTSSQMKEVLGKYNVKSKEVRKLIVKDPDVLNELYAEVYRILQIRMGHVDFIDEGDNHVEETNDDDSERVGERSRATSSKRPKGKTAKRKRVN